MKVTMSHHCGSHSSVGGAMATMKHSFNKNFRAKEEHISPDLSDSNIVLHQEDLRKAYEAEFGQAVKNYNQSQVDKGHPERQIDDYLKKIGEDKQKNVLYEHIIQFGDRNSVGVNGSSSNHIEAMKDFVKGWVLSCKLDAPAPCRLDAPDFSFVCHVLADCLHQHWQAI